MNTKNLNGSFNITINGMPYNTIEGDIYFDETVALFNSNPDLFELETVKVKTLDELRSEKLGELKASRDAYKKANGYDNDFIVQNLLLGLGNYTESERLACKIFMNNLIARYDEIKEAINNATLEKINSISTTF